MREIERLIARRGDKQGSQERPDYGHLLWSKNTNDRSHSPCATYAPR
jgi:hypothetical protein